MRFQVPQFVDIEDRVIGPLTLKQFAFYIIAIMVLGFIYIIVDLSLLIILALPVLGTAVLFAHGRFYGQSFSKLLVNAFSYLFASRLYLWRRVAAAKNLIKISGSEYDYLDEVAQLPSIDAMNQTINTAGNIVEEDAADPLLEAQDMPSDESNSKKQSAPTMGNSPRRPKKI